MKRKLHLVSVVGIYSLLLAQDKILLKLVFIFTVFKYHTYFLPMLQVGCCVMGVMVQLHIFVVHFV